MKCLILEIVKVFLSSLKKVLKTKMARHKGGILDQIQKGKFYRQEKFLFGTFKKLKKKFWLENLLLKY